MVGDIGLEVAVAGVDDAGVDRRTLVFVPSGGLTLRSIPHSVIITTITLAGINQPRAVSCCMRRRIVSVKRLEDLVVKT